MFQKIKDAAASHAILVALAPPELAKLFQEHEKGAILRTLSLLNDPKKIRFLTVLGPKGKSIAEEQQLIQVSKTDLNKMKALNYMGKIPNIQGQWFPSFSPQCPICNELLVGMQNYQVGFGQLICPRCGYKKVQ